MGVTRPLLQGPFYTTVILQNVKTSRPMSFLIKFEMHLYALAVEFLTKQENKISPTQWGQNIFVKSALNSDKSKI